MNKNTQRREIAFIASADRIRIEVEYRPMQQKRTELSITGECAGHLGQCTDTIRDSGEGVPLIARLCEIWDAYHLKAVPAKIRKELDSILDSLEDGTFGIAPDVNDAPEVGGDILDSRDVIRRLEIYSAAVVAMGLSPDTLNIETMPEPTDENGIDMEIVEEFFALRELDEQCRDMSDWTFGSTLVSDSHFEDFAKEEAESCGYIKPEVQWPYNHIDWEAAADELKSDYSSVTFKGETYWIRN